jgi:hypothetical protein
MVCPNDEEEWFTADELLEDNDDPNEMTDCKKCGLHFGSVQCFDKDCPNNTPKAVEKESIFTVGPVMMFDKVDDKLESKIIDGYEFDKIENGKIILKPIKFEYPKTYKECCDVLAMNMTRKEQMYKDWEENIANAYDEEVDDTCFSAFLDGVKWADEHPDTEDLEAVMAYTFRGLGWLTENIEADMGTMRERALSCVETLQFLCNDVIMELRNKKIHANV